MAQSTIPVALDVRQHVSTRPPRKIVCCNVRRPANVLKDSSWTVTGVSTGLNADVNTMAPIILWVPRWHMSTIETGFWFVFSIFTFEFDRRVFSRLRMVPLCFDFLLDMFNCIYTMFSSWFFFFNFWKYRGEVSEFLIICIHYVYSFGILNSHWRQISLKRKTNRSLSC